MPDRDGLVGLTATLEPGDIGVNLLYLEAIVVLAKGSTAIGAHEIVLEGVLEGGLRTAALTSEEVVTALEIETAPEEFQGHVTPRLHQLMQTVLHQGPMVNIPAISLSFLAEAHDLLIVEPIEDTSDNGLRDPYFLSKVNLGHLVRVK